ncbi:MAG: DUF4440 domain-containing protein [Blautia sp.]|nr:DUF4440 domain-containing protein [Blautia sp.]
MKKAILFTIIMIPALLLSACSAKSDEPASGPQTQTSAEAESAEASIDSSERKTEVTEKSSEIMMRFGDTKITAVLDNSETSTAFLELLPLTLDMRRYADREYYAAINELPEDGEHIPDFENGDVTYYTAGKSLAIFFGNAENSSQGDLIRMGRITSVLSLFEKMTDSVTVTITTAENEETAEAMKYDFEQFSNVDITGIDISSLNEEELAVLYAQARYCQAMTDADIDTMRELVSEDIVFTHMSGMQQTREEYFADVADGSLIYFTIGIADPVIKVDGDKAQITYTSVLNANAYGARGTYRMKGTHHYEKRDGAWIAVNR